jgi:phage shock protein PspC (stress-responsive transcriptional regulator)
MKTTINITLGGILFFVEEDAYHSLKQYLELINKHFAQIEGGNEIVQDIEYRMAELLQARLKQRQGVSMPDIDFLKQTVGYPKAEDFTTEEEAAETTTNTNNTFSPKVEPTAADSEGVFTSVEDPFNLGRRLYRDLARKKVGGVLAGLANYFGVETLWLRLGFVFFFFGFWIIPALPGFVFMAYILFMIVVKGRMDLPEPKITGAKLYRDPNDKMIAGVSGGVAAFLNIDPTIVRILFFASLFFFGSGFFVYVVLWILAPIAETRSDFLRMRGVPVTVQTMESEPLTVQGIPNRNVNYTGLGKGINTFGRGFIGVILLFMALPLMITGVQLITIGVQLGNGYSLSEIIQQITGNVFLIETDLQYKLESINSEYVESLVYTISSLLLIPGILFLLGALQMFFKKKLLNTTLVFWAIFIYLFAIGALIVQAINGRWDF